MTRAEEFIADVEAFMARHDITPTTFGKEALNDPNFVPDIRGGRKPGLGSVDRVYDFMRRYTQAMENPPCVASGASQ